MLVINTGIPEREENGDEERLRSGIESERRDEVKRLKRPGIGAITFSSSSTYNNFAVSTQKFWLSAFLTSKYKVNNV